MSADVVVLAITDGRGDLLHRTLEMAQAHLHPAPTAWYLFDDSGLDAYRDSLARRYPYVTHLNAGPRQGFGGAISAAWAQLADLTDAPWIFHLEDDFLCQQPVNLAAMIDVLTWHPYLAQMALRRQPVNSEEIAAGGVIEQHPDEYVEHTEGGHWWLEHTRFFTTNPSLYRRQLTTVGWPAGRQSEGRMTFKLREQGLPWGVPGTAVRFGYWGQRTDPPRVHHIGDTRVGTGY